LEPRLAGDGGRRHRTDVAGGARGRGQFGERSGGAVDYGEFTLGPADDESSDAIDIRPVFGAAGVNFFGTNYTSLYVNNNGNLTFGDAQGDFTPDIEGASLPIIAPFFADVDTTVEMSLGRNLVYYDLDTVGHVFTATWYLVGYWEQKTNPLNSFQVRLINRGAGDFDIEFRYSLIRWAVSDSVVARAGYSAGDFVNFAEIAASGNQTAMLQLDNKSNVHDPGRFVFQVRQGLAQICGNRIPEGTEQCDDGNTNDGDGCDVNCNSLCGNRTINPGEGCDDGNSVNGDGCSDTCIAERGYHCAGAPSVCAPGCGNGIVIGSEQCDDGNNVDGDGCTAHCTVEIGYVCVGAPSVCVGCGNGVVDGVEQCDDGNGLPNDGCSSCRIDPCHACTGQPSACSPQPDTTACDDGKFCNGADTCTGGTCVHAGSPCAAGMECDNACDEASVSCYVPAGTACTADADPLTRDQCNGQGVCGHYNIRATGMVVNNGSDNVTVFDADTLIPSAVRGNATIPQAEPLMQSLEDCVVSNDGTQGYVSDYFGRQIWVIDTFTASALPSPIAVSIYPDDLALTPDGRFLLACGIPGGQLSVVDVVLLTEVRTFDLETDCAAVDVCSDGSVLVALGDVGGRVRRLRIDGNGILTDTNDSLLIDSPFNVACAPDGRSGVVVTAGGKLQSFRLPGLVAVDQRTLGGSFGVTTLIDDAGSAAFARSFSAGIVEKFGYTPATAGLSATPLHADSAASTFPYFPGIEQMALHPFATKLYVPDSEFDVIRVLDTNGGLLGSIRDISAVDPLSVCLASRTTCGDGLIGRGEQCDDGNARDGDGCTDCRIDACYLCTGAPSVCTTLPAGSQCDDGNVCTDGDQCNSTGQCGSTSNNTAPCDDGLFCNGVDTCSGGLCTHAGTPCRTECIDSCDEVSNTCFGTPFGATCHSDGNVCTDDVCDGAGRCGVTNTASCTDGLFCNGDDTCKNGSCSAHSGNPCRNRPECDNDVCDEMSDDCFITAGTTCSDDGNVCTADQCNGSGVCVHPAGNPGTPCRAAAGLCDAMETCDGLLPTCPLNGFQPVTVSCTSDGNPCTTNDHCDGNGTCTGGPPLVCTDNNLCTTDTCAPANGCVFTPVNCDDGDSCTIDLCRDPDTGICLHTPVGEGGGCLGASNCLTACRAGVCTLEQRPNCCGNGVLDPGEQCDDRNQVSADGCRDNCTYELIPGNGFGSPVRDRSACLIEWAVINPNNTPAKDRRNRPSSAHTCRNNDPSCDFDLGPVGSATADVCEFHVVACFNNADPNLATCPQRGVAESVRLLGPSATDANRASFLDAVRNLRDPSSGATGLALPVESGQKNLCTAPFPIRVKMRRSRGALRYSNLRLTTVSRSQETSPQAVDVDSLILTCTP
jgi:cysteine-rich repeat protein